MSRRFVGVNDRGHVVGQDHHRAKLTDHEVGLVLELRADGMKIRDIAGKMDVSPTTVADICSGRTRSHLVMGQIKTQPPTRYRPRRPARPDEFDEFA